MQYAQIMYIKAAQGKLTLVFFKSSKNLIEKLKTTRSISYGFRKAILVDFHTP